VANHTLQLSSLPLVTSRYRSDEEQDVLAKVWTSIICPESLGLVLRGSYSLKILCSDLWLFYFMTAQTFIVYNLVS